MKRPIIDLIDRIILNEHRRHGSTLTGGHIEFRLAWLKFRRAFSRIFKK